MEELNIPHSTGRKENEKTRKRKREGSEDEGQFQLPMYIKKHMLAIGLWKNYR